MKKLLRQTGEYKLIRIGENQIKTKEYAFVPISNRNKNYFEGLGYKERNGFYKIKTKHLIPNSNYLIFRYCPKCQEETPIAIFNLRKKCEKCTRIVRPEKAGRQTGEYTTIPKNTFSENQPSFKTQEFIYVTANNISLRRYKKYILEEDKGLLKIKSKYLGGYSKNKIKIKCPITGRIGRYKPAKGCCCSKCVSAKISKTKGDEILGSLKKIEKKYPNLKIIEFLGQGHPVKYQKCCCLKRKDKRVLVCSGRNLVVRGPKKCRCKTIKDS